MWHLFNGEVASGEANRVICLVTFMSLGGKETSSLPFASNIYTVSCGSIAF